jgi:ankyrin repeat protein
LLLNYSAKESINKANNSGYTPLFAACERDNPKNVELLLAFGADVNKADNDGMTPLNWACANNNLEIVKLLLVHGAKESINKANNYGWTPLFWACYNNNLEIVKLLLKSGADVDQKSLDAAQDKPEILELLTLVQNYDKNIKTGEYFELPKGKENDENDAENNKKLLAFVDELNETRKKIILNKLEKKLSWQLEQNKGKKIKKFGNVEFKYQDDNKVTEFQVSPGEFKKLIEKRKREEEEENDNDNLNKRRKTDE